MKKLLLITGILLASFSLASYARSGGGGEFGGTSSSHTSSEGLKNTNGPNSADRDTGLNRAEDRMSKKGLSHEQATNDTHHNGKNKPQHRRLDTDNGKVK